VCSECGAALTFEDAVALFPPDHCVRDVETGMSPFALMMLAGQKYHEEWQAKCAAARQHLPLTKDGSCYLLSPKVLAQHVLKELQVITDDNVVVHSQPITILPSRRVDVNLPRSEPLCIVTSVTFSTTQSIRIDLVTGGTDIARWTVESGVTTIECCFNGNPPYNVIKFVIESGDNGADVEFTLRGVKFGQDNGMMMVTPTGNMHSLFETGILFYPTQAMYAIGCQGTPFSSYQAHDDYKAILSRRLTPDVFRRFIE
jgi:hypothetical protein